MFCHNKHKQGQSLNEYALGIVLVVIPATAALLLLGDNIGSLFNGMLQQSPPANTSAAVIAPPQGSPGNMSEQNNGSLVTGIAQNTGLQPGPKAYLNPYPANLKESVTTAGANGTTNQLLLSLEAVIHDLQASGQLSPAQSDTLTKLANQGHKIAELEKEMEMLLHKNPMSEEDKARISHIGSLIGWGSPGVYGAPGVDYYETDIFRKLYEQAVQDGTFKDPATQEVVNLLVNQINNIANGMENAYGEILEQGASPDQLNALVAKWMTERDESLGIDTQKSILEVGAGATTDNKSADICAAGGSTDSGTNCQTKQ